MKLIIDIPDEFSESVNQYGVIDTFDNSLIEFAIKNGTPLKEWLKTFNTDSAPQCFNAVQELKKKVGFNEINKGENDYGCKRSI